MRSCFPLPAWAGILGLVLLFVVISLSAEAADLIVPVGGGTDATGDATYDDGWIDSTYWMNGWDIEFTGDLVINATGLVDANITGHLDVDGDVRVLGTLDLDSLGDHSMGSFHMATGSTVTFSSSVITLTDESTGGRAFYREGGTFDANEGTITVTTGDFTIVRYGAGSGNIHNLIINAVGNWVNLRGTAFTITGDLTVNDYGVSYYSVGDSWNIQGDIVVNSGGHFGGSSLWTGTVTTNSMNVDGGTLISPAEIIITGEDGVGWAWQSNSGTVTNSGGIVRIQTGAVSSINYDTNDFYDLEINSGNRIDSVPDNKAIENNLYVHNGTIRTSSYWQRLNVGGGVVVNASGVLGHVNEIGDWSFGWLDTGSGSTTLSSGTTTITSRRTSGLRFLEHTGTLDANGGEISLTVVGTVYATLTGTGNVYDFTIDANAGVKLNTDITIEGNLTLNAGSFNNDYDRTIVVIGDVVMNVGANSMNHAGYDGSFTADAIEIYSGATFWFSTTTTTIVGEYQASNHGFYAGTGSTVEGNGGTLVMDAPGTPEVTERGTGSIHNLLVEDYCSWVYALSITGDLTLNDTFKESTDHQLDAAGDLIINSGGWLWWIDGTADASFDSITINSGGKVTATAGTITARYLINNAGVDGWVHNEGELYLSTASTSSHVFNSAVFWDVTLTGTGRHRFNTANDEIWIENNLDVTFETGKYLEIYSSEFRFGTETQAATITGDCYFYTNGAASQYVELWSVSQDYPAVISMAHSGIGKGMDMWYYTSLKWVVFQSPIQFNDATKTLKLDGDSSIGDLNLGASDIFNQQGYHLTVTGLFIPDGTYSHTTTAKLTIESGGNYTMVRNSEYRKVYVDGDLLAGGFDLTVTNVVLINGTGRMWAGSGNVTIGEEHTSAYALTIMELGRYYGGSGENRIGSILAVKNSRLYYSSGDTYLTSYMATSYMCLYVQTNYNFPMGGNVIIDKWFSFSQEQRLYSSGFNVIMNFNNLYVNDTYKFQTYLTSSNYCQMQINYLEVNDYFQHYGVSSPDLEKTYINTNGTVVNAGGELLLNYINDDCSFGYLNINSGSCTLSSGTTTITYKNSGSYSFDNDGTLDASDGIIRFTYQGDSYIGMTSGSGNIYTMEVDKGAEGNILQTVDDMTIDGDLTIVEGTFGGKYNNLRTFEVLGDTIVESGGFLKAAVSVGINEWVSFTTNSLTVESGGTYEATSSTTTITGELGLYCVDFQTGSTFDANGGLFKVTTPSDTKLDNDGAGDFYDFECGKPTGSLQIDSGTSFTITHDATVSDGTWINTWRQITINGDLFVIGDQYIQNQGFTTVLGNVYIDGLMGVQNGGYYSITGNVFVNDTLNMWVSGQTQTNSVGSLTINSGGTVESTSGVLTMGGSFTNNAGSSGFIHNEGTVYVPGLGYSISIFPDDAVFWNIDLNTNHHVTIYDSFRVINNLDLDHTSLDYAATVHTEPLDIIYFGSDTQSCTITGTDGLRIGRDRKFHAYNEDYPFFIENTHANFFIKDHDDLYLSGAQFNNSNTLWSGIRYRLEGDCTFRGDLIVGSGSSLYLNGNTLTIDGGDLVTDGTFTTDTDTSIRLYNGATYTMNQDVDLHHLYLFHDDTVWDCGGNNFTTDYLYMGENAYSEDIEFDCGSGRVEIGLRSGRATYPLNLRSGLFYGNNSRLLIWSFLSYGTLTYSSEDTYFNGKNGGSSVTFHRQSGAINHNNGRVIINTTSLSYYIGNQVFNDVIYNGTDMLRASTSYTGYTWTVDGDLTVLNGQLHIGEKENDNLQCGGFVRLYNSSTLDIGNAQDHIVHGLGTYSSASRVIAPSGNLIVRGAFNMDGSSNYVHSNGTIWFDTDTDNIDVSMYMGGSTFYNVLFDSDHGDYLHVYETMYVENMVDGTLSLEDGWNYFRFNSNLYLGTVSNRGIARNINLHGTPHTFSAISKDFPGKWESNLVLERGDHTFKWIEFENYTAYPSGMSFTITLSFTGDCWFNSLNLSNSLGYTLFQNGHDLFFRHLNFGQDFTTDGDITINGTGTFLDLWIDTGDTLDASSATGDVVTTYLEINGTYSATPETTWINYTGTTGQYRCTAGSMIHNEGTFNVAMETSDYFYAGEASKFWNIYLRQRIYLQSDLWIENNHTGSYWCVKDTPKTVTLGTSSNSGYSSTIYAWSTNITVTAVSEDYPATVNSLRHRHGGAYLNAYWLTINDYDTDVLDSTNGRLYVRGDSNMAGALTLEDNFKIWLAGGNMTFQDTVSIESGSALYLDGYHATFDGALTNIAGTLGTGGFSRITLTENASWTPNQNLTLAEFKVDCSIEITSANGIRNITFTDPAGFSNSTGTINVTGSYGDLVYLTGTPYWEIKADAIDYFWKYVNISHGYNVGSSALVALGEGFDLIGPWDFQAPLITPHFITEGKFIDTRYTSILQLDWTAEDMSYLYALNITISDYLGSIIFTREIDESTFGITAAYRWNISVSIENLTYGRLFINYTASDAHNSPASQKARKNADAMLCDLDGELVGHPSGKDKSDKLETNTIKFKKAGPFVSDLFDIEFLTDNKGSQHVVKWTGDNFKMSHWVKLDHGTSVPMRITADSIEHIPASEFGAAHFLINGNYFYDASDFEATGGKILLLDQGTIDGKEYVTISFTHPDWKKGGGWGLIDPLTGAINSRSEFYNISVGTIPEVVIPKDNAKLPGDSTSTTLKVRVYGAGSFEGTVDFYNESGVLLGSQHNVTNNTVAIVELESLGTDTLYPWYVVFSVGGENFTSPTWSFRTGGLEGKSAAPGSGRERYGDSATDPPDPTTIVFFIIFITLIVLLMRLWIGEEVKRA